MKTANFIFKLAAMVLAIGAAVCFLLANVEKISDSLLTLRAQISMKRRSCCCSCDEADEFED